MDIKKAKAANKLVEDLKTVILSNTIVRIVDRETRTVLWSCNTGKYYGKLEQYEGELDIEQDTNLEFVLEELEKLLK